MLAPESMQETFMSDSEDEGGEYTRLLNVSSRIRNLRQFLTMFRVRIRIDLALLNPDPSIGNADPDPGARKLTKIYK